jgi:nucleotide-binding universal stress UspA family protein
MTRQALIESVQQFLDAEIRLQQRRSTGAQTTEELARIDQASRTLRAAIASAAEQDHSIATVARIYLDAAEEFERAREARANLDLPARQLERAQQELTFLLSRLARHPNGADHVAAHEDLPQTNAEHESPSALRIVAAVDGSPCALWAVAAATRLCEATSGRLLLVHAIDPLAGTWTDLPLDPPDRMDERREAGAKLLATIKQSVSPDLRCDVQLVDGDPAEAIVATARRWGADLIAVGTHGRNRFTRFLVGSTADEIVRLANCPVIVVGHDPRVLHAWQTDAHTAAT